MSVALLVQDALIMLSTEHRHAYNRVRDVLGSVAIDGRVDGETVVVAFVTEATSRVEIRTDLDTICDLLEGEVRLQEALLADRLHVVGTTDDLISLGTVLTVFLEGAMRCVSITTLVNRLYSLREGLKS